jgi:hypothetical protein
MLLVRQRLFAADWPPPEDAVAFVALMAQVSRDVRA